MSSMPFRYTCFLSYRHGQNELTRARITQLFEALENEVRQFVDLPVYVDYDRLQPGYLYNEALASELCSSVCMVMAYTPTYFDQAHPYCAREYKGMEKLEAERMALVPRNGDMAVRGLIIPIAFRGADRLPREITEKRLYENFDTFALGERKLSKHPKFKHRIKVIAEYVAERYDALIAAGADACGGCLEFRLPSDNDVREWLKTVCTQPLGFPGHEVGL